MKVLVDTNIWLDIITNREPFHGFSRAAVLACINDGVGVIVAATSIKDIFYLVAKHLGVEKAYEAVEMVLSIADVATVDELVCTKALKLERPDYEDGIIAAAAAIENVACIISRDKGAFRQGSIKRYGPEEFLRHQGYEKIDL